jgi:hypothetical protein
LPNILGQAHRAARDSGLGRIAHKLGVPPQAHQRAQGTVTIHFPLANMTQELVHDFFLFLRFESGQKNAAMRQQQIFLVK